MEVPSNQAKMVEAFIAENPYAAEAARLLKKAIEVRSLRRAETFASLAIAYEQRQTRCDIGVELQNHAQQTQSV